MNKKEVIKIIKENIESWLYQNILSEGRYWELNEEGFMKEVKKTFKKLQKNKGMNENGNKEESSKKRYIKDLERCSDKIIPILDYDEWKRKTSKKD